MRTLFSLLCIEFAKQILGGDPKGWKTYMQVFSTTRKKDSKKKRKIRNDPKWSNGEVLRRAAPAGCAAGCAATYSRNGCAAMIRVRTGYFAAFLRFGAGAAAAYLASRLSRKEP